MDSTEKLLECRLLVGAAEAVIDEYLLVDGVVLAAVHVGTIVRRSKGHYGHPRERHDCGDQTGNDDLSKLVGPPFLTSEQIGEAECGQHQPRLEHLGLEGNPHPHPGVHEMPLSARHQRRRQGISRQHEEQRHGGVGDIAAIERDGCGTCCEDESRDEGCCRPPEPVDRAVEEEDTQDTLDDLRQDNRPGVVAEDPNGQCLHPECTGQLVQGDRPGWIKGAEEEVVPVGSHASYGCAVEGLESILADAPGVRKPGYTCNQKQKRPRDGRP